MSEEEKKALEDIKSIVDDLEETEQGAIIALQQDEIDSLKIIAELIEKQQKEIEELEDTLKCTQNSWYKDTKVIETQQKEIEVLREENFDTVYMKAVADFKDKIREKIKKYDKWIEKGEYTESLEAQRYALNELLEE